MLTDLINYNIMMILWMIFI